MIKKDERFLLILSFSSFVIGFLILLFVYLNIKIETLDVSQIEEKYLFKKIEVKGKVEKIVEKEKVNFIRLRSLDENCKFCYLDIIVFPNIYQYLKDKIHINATYCIIGKLQLYNDIYEIILESPNNIKEC